MSTHVCNGVSERDAKLAHFIEQAAAAILAEPDQPDVQAAKKAKNSH